MSAAKRVNLSNDSLPTQAVPGSELQRQLDIMLNNWTQTHHINDAEFDLLRSPVWRGIIMTLYITVIMTGTIGNCIVVYVVIKNRNLQCVTNVFIGNLAMSDIGLCVFSLPMQLYYQLTDHWLFGEALCRIIFAAFAVPMYVSSLTILLIAADRYWLIVYPLQSRMSLRTAVLLILLVGLTSLLLSVPIMYFSKIHTINDPLLKIYRQYCMESWPSPIARDVYSIIMFLLQFLIPLSITTIIYFRIYHRLKTRRLKKSEGDRKQRTNKILIAIVSLFTICWFPWNTFSLITEMSHHAVKGIHFKLVDLILKLFAMSSVCINPFLYCWLNDNFRKEIDHLAVRLYRKTSAQRRGVKTSGGNYQLQVPGEENGRTTTDAFGTVTIEHRLSTSVNLV